MENEKFDKVVIAFDEALFIKQSDLVSQFCENANAAIAELQKEYDLPLTDIEIKAMFMDLDNNPDRLIEKHFANQKSKTLREESIKDLRDYIHDLLFDFRQFDGTTRKAIYVKRGKLVVDPVQLQKIKESCETSLNSPRAVDLYNKHQELFTKFCEFQEAAGNALSVRSLWYEDLNQGIFRIKEFNYNNL